MKKVLTLLFLIVSIMTLGQNLINFNNSNATWDVAKTYPHGNPQYPNFVETTTNVYGYNGDTLIGTDLWLKMYTSPDSNFISNSTYLGNIKEANGLVYFMDTTHLIHTIYNFNLQVGDSVLYNFEFGNYYLKIENIDSVFLNGEYYKQFHFQEPWFIPFYLKEVWIEEIGSIHGPLFSAYPRIFETEIPDSLYLTCFKLNNTIVWNNPNYSQCFINIILSTWNLPRKHIKIFPNPVSNNLVIEFPTFIKTNQDISIYNLDGKLMKCQMNHIENTVEINITSFEKGVYILQINADNNLYKQKLLKQ